MTNVHVPLFFLYVLDGLFELLLDMTDPLIVGTVLLQISLLPLFGPFSHHLAQFARILLRLPGSASHELTQSWKDSADYTTVADGGDPSINSFANTDEWSKWARSVETGSPIVTTYTLTPLSDLIADQGKQANFDRAVQEYGAKYNVTAPPADLVNVTMDWCDCYAESIGSSHSCNQQYGQSCHSLRCLKSGYVSTAFELNLITGIVSGSADLAFGAGKSSQTMTCCRPCFTAHN